MSFAAPRAFVSYSWSSPEHERWVISLSEELRASGVDVVLDKWDLREGHDAVAFMESMVTDQSIAKVIIVTDRLYAEKTNARVGGVGTEAQIISQEIYRSQRQDRFAAVVREYDDAGMPYIPQYYKSRIFIDMSDDNRYSERFEQLLRWVFDKPLHIKPDIGQPPSFLTDEKSVSRSSSSERRKAINAVVDGARAAPLSGQIYVGKLIDEILADRLNPDANPFDDAVFKSISYFHQEIIEFADYCNTCAATLPHEDLVSRFSEHLERMIPMIFRPTDVFSYKEWDWDNWKYLAQEMFLYLVAACLKHRRFAEISEIIDADVFYSRGRDFGYRGKMIPVTEFRSHLGSLDFRSKRLSEGQNSRRASIHADLLKERCVGSSIDFESLMQADFFMFLRGFLGVSGYWHPESLLYVPTAGPFEIFARSRSRRYFDRLRVAFNVADAETFRANLTARIQGYENSIPRFGWHRLEIWELSAASGLSSSP